MNISNNNFGVYIRSVGERTERLCYESVIRYIPRNNIHIIKNQYPASKAFDMMFCSATQHSYDWYMGVDADVVLVSGWWLNAKDVINSYNTRNIFSLSFPMKDLFAGVVDKGNHFFNGAYSQQALHALRTYTQFTLKPESSIKKHIPNTNSIYLSHEKPLGFHGYDQYYIDIFYRFYLQHKRSRRKKNTYSFLKRNHEHLTNDEMVARLGWSLATKHRVLECVSLGLWKQPFVSDMRARSWMRTILKHHHIYERKDIDCTLSDFLNTKQ